MIISFIWWEKVVYIVVLNVFCGEGDFVWVRCMYVLEVVFYLYMVIGCGYDFFNVVDVVMFFWIGVFKDDYFVLFGCLLFVQVDFCERNMNVVNEFGDKNVIVYYEGWNYGVGGDFEGFE